MKNVHSQSTSTQVAVKICQCRQSIQSESTKYMFEQFCCRQKGSRSLTEIIMAVGLNLSLNLDCLRADDLIGLFVNNVKTKR